MENNETAYKMLITQIRNASPLLKDPEKMTHSIIEKIEKINGLKQKQKSRRINIAGIISGIAAGLLLCLLVYDNTTQIYDFARPEPVVRQETAINIINPNNSLKNKTIKELVKEKTTSFYKKQYILCLIKKQ